MKKIILINLLFLSSLYSQDYYFSKYSPFDDNIMSPEQFLGYPVGEMHTRHDLIVSYMEYLSKNSEKAQIYPLKEKSKNFTWQEDGPNSLPGINQ